MVRPTSKAAFLEIKESGVDVTQAGKILAIVHDLKSSSLQEIMAEYRQRHGTIEYGSISARVNLLKNGDNPQVQEGTCRKCTISAKTINPIEIIGQCSHSQYKTDKYEYNGKKLKSVWRGIRVNNCSDCGADISHFNIVPIKTHKEHLKSIKDE